MSISAKTKKSLLISILTIALCVTLLTGTTLAWFSNVSDTRITVNTTSGLLDADIVDINDVSLVGNFLNFVTTTNTPETNLEPGATFYTVGFKVKNIGNVKMKYLISINLDKDSKLYEALDFWIVEAPDNSEQIPTRLDFSKDKAIPITEYEGTLDPNSSSKTYHLVMKMSEDAGNEYQGLQLDYMGITVDAAQSNADDSALDKD